MYELIKILLAGLAISFLGSLPLGTLNITAMQIAVTETVRKALLFAAGVALVEIVYVRLSLKGIDWIMANQTIFRAMEWATVFIFAALGINSLLAARRQAEAKKNIILTSKLNRFALGLSMSAVNPAQIPFWFAWSAYLFTIGLLKHDTAAYNSYIIGIGLGTCLGLLLFIYGGRWLTQKLNASQRILNLLVGVVFIVSSMVQLVRLISR